MLEMRIKIKKKFNAMAHRIQMGLSQISHGFYNLNVKSTTQHSDTDSAMIFIECYNNIY